jgi:hypothetical protein
MLCNHEIWVSEPFNQILGIPLIKEWLVFIGEYEPTLDIGDFHQEPLHRDEGFEHSNVDCSMVKSP